MTRWSAQKTGIGALTATVLPMGEISDSLCDWFAAEALAVPAGVSHLPVNALHVGGPGVSVLIDACDPARYPGSGQVGAVGAYLGRAGIDPESITHVIVTHGHHDHFCGLADSLGEPTFPFARHILSHLDWGDGTLTAEAQAADGKAADPAALEHLFRLGLLDLGDSARPLPPEITLIDTAGETRGHRVVRIASGGEVLYFLADLFHVRAEIDDPNLCPVWADTPALQASRSRIITAIRRDTARFVCSHLPDVFSAAVFMKTSR
jgi:glyoxylase-like metal-dependent hydrolase (beta-lactamase superfamily II)